MSGKKVLRVALWATVVPGALALAARATIGHKTMLNHCELYRLMWTGKTGKAD